MDYSPKTESYVESLFNTYREKLQKIQGMAPDLNLPEFLKTLEDYCAKNIRDTFEVMDECISLISEGKSMPWDE